MEENSGGGGGKGGGIVFWLFLTVNILIFESNLWFQECVQEDEKSLFTEVAGSFMSSDASPITLSSTH